MSRKKGKSKKEKAAERYEAGRPSKYAAKHEVKQPVKDRDESTDGRF